MSTATERCAVEASFSRVVSVLAAMMISFAYAYFAHAYLAAVDLL